MNTNTELHWLSFNTLKSVISNHLIILLCVCALTALIHTGNAFARSTSAPLSSDGLGLIVAKTQTTTGHEFCQGFLSHWRDLGDIESINLTLSETVDAMNGLQIGIYFNGKLIFQTRLSQTSETDPTLSKQVSEVVHYRVMAQNRQHGRWFDPDLAPDEW